MEITVEGRAQELLTEANRQAVQRERELEERTANMLEVERNQKTGPYTSSSC